MRLEEGEVIFGKRWADWNEKERREFVAALEIKDLVYPIYLNWALCYAGSLQPEVRQWLDSRCEEALSNN